MKNRLLLLWLFTQPYTEFSGDERINSDTTFVSGTNTLADLFESRRFAARTSRRKLQFARFHTAYVRKKVVDEQGEILIFMARLLAACPLSGLQLLAMSGILELPGKRRMQNHARFLFHRPAVLRGLFA